MFQGVEEGADVLLHRNCRPCLQFPSSCCRAVSIDVPATPPESKWARQLAVQACSCLLRRRAPALQMTGRTEIGRVSPLGFQSSAVRPRTHATGTRDKLRTRSQSTAARSHHLSGRRRRADVSQPSGPQEVFLMLRTESRNEDAVMSKVTLVGGGLGTGTRCSQLGCQVRKKSTGSAISGSTVVPACPPPQLGGARSSGARVSVAALSREDLISLGLNIGPGGCKRVPGGPFPGLFCSSTLLLHIGC